MFDYIARWVALAFLSGSLNDLADRHYRALPPLPADDPVTNLPSLSIIVPARNEAENLKYLLPSLTRLFYPGFIEWIVVDDNSSDDTARIAANYGARVVQLEILPAGWAGKSYACHQGALVSHGDWLLFTDADTIHNRQGAARAVSYALTNKLDGLSVFIKQETTGVLDTLALSAAFAGLFAGLKRDNPALNGQYILLRREVYDQCGGFSSVAGETMEDVALGHHLRALLYDVPLLRSDDIASVKMYNNNASLWQGLTRLGSVSLRWMGARSVLMILSVTANMAPILALLNAIAMRQKRKWAVLSWLAVSLSLLPWFRRFGAARLTVLAPIGALIVQLAALLGLIRRILGLGSPWRGRNL